MFLKILTIMALCCYTTTLTNGLTIREVSAEDVRDVATTSSATDSSYRKSVAKIKETSYRVPEHLQFIPKGFVYEDAADVIHVIDPPKHFEELKKIMQSQEQRQLQNRRPIALREYRAKPKILKTMMQAKHPGEPVPRKALPEADMQIQETQQLPMEILASVRKTENYLRKYKPKLPAAKQRLMSHKIQTVIWEQQQEQQQYQQGQEQRVQGIREQTAQRKRFNIKRFKRSITPDAKPLKGEELLNHINDLIKNASIYLKQTENYEDYPDTDFQTTTLQGEILVRTTKAPSTNNNALNEDMVVKILENSVKATNVIMQQIKQQTNLTTVTEKCDHLKVTYPNHVKNLQNQIKCMQNFIKEINQTQHQAERRQLQQQRKQKQQKQQKQQHQLDSVKKFQQMYGEHLEVRKTKDLRHKPFLIAQLSEDYFDDDAAPSPLNSSLIYDDVMTTIRNMLQRQNLQSIEDVAAATVTSSWQDSSNDSSFTYDKSTEAVDFENLNKYLASLETIVTNLPKFNHKSLNLQEIEGGSTSKYYFINPQGTIYSLPQPFQKDLITTAPTTIFHQFLDTPIVSEYLKNGTILPPSPKVVEIL